MTNDESTDTKIAVMQNDMSYMKHMIEQVDRKLDTSAAMVSMNYVTKEEFSAKTQKYDLVVKVVFGLVAFILVAVLGAIVNLVVNGRQP